jgi:hypothetical protein
MPVSGLVVTLTPIDPAPGSDHRSSRDSFQGSATAPGEVPGHRSTHTYGSSPGATLPGLTTGAGDAGPGYPAVIEQIRQHPNFQAGPRQDQRLPVVLDTPDKETDKRCWGWLNELPGVHHVDVAFIHFEDEDALDASPCSANADRPIAAPTIGET